MTASRQDRRATDRREDVHVAAASAKAHLRIALTQLDLAMIRAERVLQEEQADVRGD